MFLAATAARPLFRQRWPEGGDAFVRARYIGNCLRELDRFLGALLDERNPLPPTRRLTVRRTVVARLADHDDGGWDVGAAQRRLTALGLSRSCLFHDGGRVRRTDVPHGQWLTAGWYAAGAAHLARYPLGALLRPDTHDLTDIAAFYLSLGDRIALRRATTPTRNPLRTCL